MQSERRPELPAAGRPARRAWAFDVLPDGPRWQRDGIRNGRS